MSDLLTVLVAVSAVAAVVLAGLPAGLMLANLKRFHRSPEPAPGAPAVSVLVPARNEAAVIDGLIECVLASQGCDLELLILDDASTDDTAKRVAAWAARDPRVRLVHGQPLPAGWCGKQHACQQLADAAQRPTLVFLDADVRIRPEAIAQAITFLHQSGGGLVSGFPLQETPAFLDWLLLPLIHFILLGFLPLSRSRASLSPALAAGCGQFFITTQAAYRQAGGHAAIRASLHDGVMLPRAFRRAGLQTDIFDATDTATCRMYETSREVFGGLAKNATEGIGSPRTIVPFTLLLAGGQVLPAGLLGLWLAGRVPSGWPVALAAFACSLSYLPRLLGVMRFRQSLGSSLLHPLAIVLFLGIQWYALVRRGLGLSTSWKGRRLTPQ